MEFPHSLARYACPLINPPAQRHLFHNKIHNIQLAIDRMRDRVLAPGEAFSFWDVVPAPTRENGFRDGAMFINFRVTTSVGGGLCQLSGLIYNLALLSGCAIEERHPHSIDAYGEARYIPLGRDATVAHGRKNLRFRNPHPFPIRLHLAVDEHEARGEVFGAAALDAAIDIRCETRRTLASPRRWRHDPALAAGEERVEPGLTGKEVLAWRVRRDADGREAIEPLSRDRYRATPTLLYRRRAAPVAWLCSLARLLRL